MIDSSLPDGPWAELELGLEKELVPEPGSFAITDPWNESESWIDDDPWTEEDCWDDDNLSESLTLKYLGPQAIATV